MTNNIPSRLYKYKSFNVDSLDLLVSDSLYFADPTTFNDPLDCNPSVQNNMGDVDALNAILHKLVKDNHQKELEEAAAKIKYRGQKTLDKIDTLGESEAQKLINRIAENVDFFGDPHGQSVSFYIKRYLLQNYTVGVLSLAKEFDCPLMWSHYADQHKGFCIGYDVSIDHIEDIYPIDYEGKRFITTQQVYDMLFGNTESLKRAAKKEIDKVILLSKAPAWKYEHEFRVISKQGLQDSPFRLSDVTFGLRFKPSAKYAVMKSLQGRSSEINFYEISLCDDSFELKREPIDLDNIYLRRFPASHYEYALEMYEAFDSLSNN